MYYRNKIFPAQVELKLVKGASGHHCQLFIQQETWVQEPFQATNILLKATLSRTGDNPFLKSDLPTTAYSTCVVRSVRLYM